MITLDQYFGQKISSPDATSTRIAAAGVMLQKVNDLLSVAEHEGMFTRKISPNTGTEISGAKGGSGDGGFRLSTSTTGANKSQHKEARAVDVYDPGNLLDGWLTDKMLERFGLYREHPDATPGWCHLQDVPPRSGNRTFRP